MGAINEKTSVPIYWLFCALPFLIAGIFWMASVDSKASSAKDELAGLKELVIDVRERTIRIEEDLKNQK